MTQKLTGPALVAYLRQFPSSDDREWAAEEIERLRNALQEATDALSGGLWDYGPGQDEHEQCQRVIDRCRAVLGDSNG